MSQQSSDLNATSKEELVVKYVSGEVEPPQELMALVNKYREYVVVRGECVSYPAHVDQDMNKLFDALVVLA